MIGSQMPPDRLIKVGLYLASAISLLACLYLINLGVYVEWSASFPGRPADAMRPWAYLYYGLALASLIASVLLFRRALRRGRSDKNNVSPSNS
jgi:hypothetical protein